MQREISALKKRGIEVREVKEGDELVYRIETQSVVKQLRKEVREKLLSVFKLSPAEFKFRTVKGVEMGVLIARGVMTEADREKLILLQKQYGDGFQWNYNEKSKTLRVVIVLNEFYRRGIEELVNKVNNQLAEASALLVTMGAVLDYKIGVGKEIEVRIRLSAES